MKRKFAFLLCALFMVFGLVACGEGNVAETPDQNPDSSPAVTNDPASTPEPAEDFVYGDGVAEFYDLDGHVICVGATSGQEVYILHLSANNWELRYFQPQAGPLSAFIVDGVIVDVQSPAVGAFLSFLEEMGVVEEMTNDFNNQIGNMNEYIERTYGMDVTALGASGQLPAYYGEVTLPQMPGTEQVEPEPQTNITVNDDGTVLYITTISSEKGTFEVECSGIVENGVVTIQSVFNPAFNMDVTAHNDLAALSAEAQAVYDANK